MKLFLVIVNIVGVVLQEKAFELREFCVWDIKKIMKDMKRARGLIEEPECVY